MAETKDKIVSLEVLKDTRDSLKTEIDGKVAKEEGKGLSTNDFTDEYKNKVDSALDDYVESDPTVPAWAKEAKKPTYTPEEVGAEASGTVSAHNIAEDAHEDIRGLIADLNDGKVNVADIIDNLVTSATNKPLSAAQGVALKALIDGLSSGKLDSSALASAIEEALAQAKASGEFKGEDGTPGAPGTSVTIVSVSESSEDGGENTVVFSDGSKITIKNGSTGQDGVIGKDGKDGEDGEDGVSVTHSWDGTVLTITSASGTSSADLKGADGQPGVDGKDGKDGVSPTHSWDGTVLTVTSASGTSSADLKGRDGSNGVHLGTTEPDDNACVWINPDGIVTTQEDIINKVLAAIPQWEGGNY